TVVGLVGGRTGAETEIAGVGLAPSIFREQRHREHRRHAVVSYLTAVLDTAVVEVNGILFFRFQGLVVPDGHVLDPREIDLLSTGDAREREKDQYGYRMPHFHLGLGCFFMLSSYQ